MTAHRHPGTLARLAVLATAVAIVAAACAVPAPMPVDPSDAGGPTLRSTPRLVATPLVSAPGASAPRESASGNLRIVIADGLVTADAPPGSDPLDAVPSELVAGEAVWVIATTEDSASALALVVADRDVIERELPFGWIELEVDGRPTLAAPELRCPQPPLRVNDLRGLGRFGGLACYGGRPVTVDAFAPVACGMGGSPRTGEPDWLNGTWSGVDIGDAEPTAERPEVPSSLKARIAPDAGIDACGDPGWYRFTGHFDDPASRTCRTTDQTPAGVLVVLDARLTELLCRAELVLDRAVPIGALP